MPNNRFSAVQLTLLSVIVALILENLLNQFSDESLGWSAVLPWLQSASVAITVVSVWSGFALILTTSERKPEAVDFIYPFGLLITLTLAANSLGHAQLTKFFVFLCLGGLFACWALRTELLDLEPGSAAANGVGRALYIQAASATLCLIMTLLLIASSPPQAVVIFALVIAVILPITAALGTMRGWRSISEGANSGLDTQSS